MAKKQEIHTIMIDFIAHNLAGDSETNQQIHPMGEKSN
jgi:hypothetical protein